MVRTCLDSEELAERAAQIFVEQCKKLIEQSGRFKVALSGGNTPERTYALLSESAFRKKLTGPVYLFSGETNDVCLTIARIAIMEWHRELFFQNYS